MREKPKETRHERGVRGYSAGIGRCSRGRCSSEQRLVATRGRWSDGVVCAEQRLYSFSWKLLTIGASVQSPLSPEPGFSISRRTITECQSSLPARQRVAINCAEYMALAGTPFNQIIHLTGTNS